MFHNIKIVEFLTDSYWPGVLSMVGDISNAMKSIYNYHSVWKQYGFLPEFYNSKHVNIIYFRKFNWNFVHYISSK